MRQKLQCLRQWFRPTSPRRRPASPLRLEALEDRQLLSSAGLLPVNPPHIRILANPAHQAVVWSPQKQDFSSAELQAMEADITQFMQQFGVPGASIATAKDDRLVYARGFGFADTATGEQVTPASRFRIASLSKQITSAAIFTLVDQGRLHLSDRVFGEGGILGTQYGHSPYGPNIEKITVQNLLEHTAGGWSNEANDPMFSNPNLNQDQLISWVLDNRPLDTVPGTQYAYSNFGYCILGRIIEKVTGQPYADYVQGAVLSRCGIHEVQDWPAYDLWANFTGQSVSLQQGNLYRISGTSQTLIDTWVSAYATDASGHIFDLTSAGQVKEYSGSGTTWTAVTGSNTTVYSLVTANGGPYMLASNGGKAAVWRYSGSGSDWTPVTGSNTTVYALSGANGGLFMLANNGSGVNQVWQYSGSGSTWFTVTGTNSSVSTLAAANGELVGVSLDLTRLSASVVRLDSGQSLNTASVQVLTLQPGTHTLADQHATGAVVFTVNADGTISYASNLEGVLSGQGTNHLTVNGAAVSFNAAALAPPQVTVSYDAALQGILTGKGSKQLVVNGAAITVNATALNTPSLTADYASGEQTKTPFSLILLPGTHVLAGSTGAVSFTVNPDGTVSFPSSESALLFSPDGRRLTVKALK